MSESSWPYGLYPARLLCPWDSPGETTGVDCHSLLQGIFLTTGSDSVSCLAGGFFTAEPPGRPQCLGLGQLTNFHVSSLLAFKLPYEVSPISPILKMRKLRCHNVRYLVRGHSERRRAISSQSQLLSSSFFWGPGMLGPWGLLLNDLCRYHCNRTSSLLQLFLYHQCISRNFRKKAVIQ